MKKSLLFLLLGAFFFVACDKEETTIMEDSSSFSIDGYVRDADGNILMENVVVKGAFGETKTDAKGYFKVSGLNHGEYSLIYSASGYGEKILTYNLGVTTDTPLEVDYTKSVIVDLYKMEESISTTIWKVDNKMRSAFANVPFTIELGDEYLYNKIEGTTDASGNISLTDTLPDSNVTLKIEYIDAVKGKVYKLTTDFTPSSVAKSYTVIEESLSDDLYLLTSNIFDTEGNESKNLAVGTSLTFTFNQDLTSKTTATLYNTTEGRSVAVNVSYSGKVLTIDPIGDLTKIKNYRVIINAESIDDEYNNTFYFSTEGAITSLDKVTSVSLKNEEKVYIDTRYTNIKFAKVNNADYYEVFAKYGTQTEYRKLTSTINATSSTTATEENDELYMYNTLDDMNMPSTGMFDEGNKFTIIIRAVSGDIYGAFSEPFAIQKNATK